jgi:serine protease Do
MSDCPNGSQGCQSRIRPQGYDDRFNGMNRALGLFGVLMLGCTLILLAVLIKSVGEAPPTEDAAEGMLAAMRAPNPSQPAIIGDTLQFPSGLGNGQLQLIAGQGMQPGQTAGWFTTQPATVPPATDTRFPSGLGNGQIQLIAGQGMQPGQTMQPVHHLGPQFPSGLGNQPIQLVAGSGPYLGLTLSRVDPGTAQRMKLADNEGAYVTMVVPDSPGEKAGIQVGDVLLRLDNKRLKGPDDVGRILAGKKAGNRVKARYQRDVATQTVHITLENAPLGLNIGTVQNTVWMGVDVQDIDAIMRVQFNLPESQGVVVSHVAPGSPAALAGLVTGDLIHRVGQTRIRDVRQFASTVHKAKPGDVLRMSAVRGGTPFDVQVTMGRRPVEPPAIATLPPADIVVEGAWIGMDVGDLKPTDIKDLNLPASTRGVLVIDVEGPPATTVGFEAGDVIVAINNMPTPDLNSFIAASRRQDGAVVETLRGGRHLFLSVPPPGFSQQGNPMNLGIDKKFRQVAATRPSILAVLARDKDIRANVASENDSQAVVLVDTANQQYALVELRAGSPSLPEIMRQHNAASLVAGSVSPQTATELSRQGMALHAGVVGAVLDAAAMYQNQGLAAVAR